MGSAPRYCSVIYMPPLPLPVSPTNFITFPALLRAIQHGDHHVPHLESNFVTALHSMYSTDTNIVDSTVSMQRLISEAMKHGAYSRPLMQTVGVYHHGKTKEARG